LRWLGFEGHPFDVEELPVEHGLLGSPQLGHCRENLIGPRPSLGEGNSKRGELRFGVTYADREVDSPTAQYVEGADGFCQSQRVVVGENEDGGIDTNPGRRACDERHDGHRVHPEGSKSGDLPIWHGEVLGRRDGVIPQLIDALSYHLEIGRRKGSRPLGRARQVVDPWQSDVDLHRIDCN
jgi:hypothetical protein